jgi:hypothetical protein
MKNDVEVHLVLGDCGTRTTVAVVEESNTTLIGIYRRETLMI